MLPWMIEAPEDELLKYSIRPLYQQTNSTFSITKINQFNLMMELDQLAPLFMPEALQSQSDSSPRHQNSSSTPMGHHLRLGEQHEKIAVSRQQQPVIWQAVDRLQRETHQQIAQLRQEIKWPYYEKRCRKYSSKQYKDQVWGSDAAEDPYRRRPRQQKRTWSEALQRQRQRGIAQIQQRALRGELTEQEVSRLAGTNVREFRNSLNLRVEQT